MKETGIIRPVDPLGRVVIPVEIRRNLNINTDDSLEVYREGDLIILKKYEPTCVFCGNSKNVVDINGKNVCQECISRIKNL